MKTLTINLPEETLDRMNKAVRELGVSVDTLIRSSVEEKLDRLDLTFDDAARYVLEKNAELYRRLA